MNKVFHNVGGANPPRSLFNLSYTKLLTCDMGQLIPVMCDEVVPGDILEIAGSAIIRAQPLVAPPLHPVDMTVHSFFVPYRILWDEWEDFMTGGPDGTLVPTLPRWEPVSNNEVAVGSLWDYFGFPTMATYPTTASDTLPMDFPRRAYALIWNEYYRDQSLQTEYAIDPIVTAIDTPLRRNWEKDYFTSSMLTQQRGTAPAFPITGTGSAVFDYTQMTGTLAGTPVNLNGQDINSADAYIRIGSATYPTQIRQNIAAALNKNTVSITASPPLDVEELRLGFQIQRFLERNMRAGARYTEFLKAHFGVNPRDDRLDRPEYIGGMKAPIIFSEVLQTSETDTTPQGNLAGHGLTVTTEKISKYRVEEYGLVISLMSIMPKPIYQQGINRQWLRQTRYDFYFPEFAHLSEQAIDTGEVYWTDDDTANEVPFGFIGAYDEMRVKSSMVCGQFRTTYDYWHISRQFSSAPVLDDTFVICDPRKDIFAAPSEPGFLVQYLNIIKALRPLPIIAEPGLIDHG